MPAVEKVGFRLTLKRGSEHSIGKPTGVLWIYFEQMLEEYVQANQDMQKFLPTSLCLTHPKSKCVFIVCSRVEEGAAQSSPSLGAAPDDVEAALALGAVLQDPDDPTLSSRGLIVVAMLNTSGDKVYDTSPDSVPPVPRFLGVIYQANLGRRSGSSVPATPSCTDVKE